jgi:hypothetical protein
MEDKSFGTKLTPPNQNEMIFNHFLYQLNKQMIERKKGLVNQINNDLLFLYW